MSDRDEITISQAIRMFRIQREDAQRGIRSLPFDELLQKVQADEQPAKPRGVLTLVTEANASQFQQRPKRRGRPPKVREIGNVVAFRRPARTRSTDLVSEAADRICEIMEPFMAYLDRERVRREARRQKSAHPHAAGPSPKGAA